MSPIECDIILPVCDQFEFTKNCIESIIANTLIPYRIIVINNGKNEDTRAYLSDVKNRIGDRLLVIKNETNIGWVKALNQGIALSKSPYLCFQNDDTIVTKSWLEKMIKILKENKKIGLVNPSWENRPNHMSIAEYGDFIEKKYRGKYIETDWARGFSVVLKREVVDRIGNIDEIYGLAYFDDVDFSVRAINAGFLVVLALDTYVYHHRNVTFFEVLKGKRWNELHEKNKLIYYKKWGRPLKLALILNKESCANADSLNAISDTVYYLARKQHRIDIWSPCNVSDKFQHTNVTFKGPGAFFTGPAAFFALYSNSRKASLKRYSAVFSFDKGFGSFVAGKRLLNDVPVYADTLGGDFNAFIRKRADTLKEETRKHPVGEAGEDR